MSLPSPISYHIYTGHQDIPTPGLYAYALAGQGVIKLARGPHFDAAIDITGCDVAGLPDYPAGIALHVPKIPTKWLYSVLEHARRASGDLTPSPSPGGGWEKLRSIEQMYHFHYLTPGPSPLRKGGGEWRVAIPKQEATAGHVGYRGGHEASIVLDLHSHHETKAFFSATDNDDEQGFRFYGVIGRIYTRPEIRLRVGVYGDWLELDPLELFDGLGPFAEATYETD